MDPTDQTRPRGRPRKTPAKAFNFRLTNSLRARLDAAVERSGRSVTDEITRRLEWSFADEDPAAALYRSLRGPEHVRPDTLREFADRLERIEQALAQAPIGTGIDKPAAFGDGPRLYRVNLITQAWPVRVKDA